MKNSIILIGPMCAGKSTLAELLSRKLNIRNVPMDDVRWFYYYKNGFDLLEQKKCKSFEEVVRYWKPFELNAISGLLRDFPNAIVDFGAGHSHYAQSEQLEVARCLLDPYPDVFLILPSSDKEESVKILNQRFADLILKEQRREPTESELEINREFVFHKSNHLLAKKIFYTEHMTAADTTDEMIHFLRESNCL